MDEKLEIKLVLSFNKYISKALNLIDNDHDKLILLSSFLVKIETTMKEIREK